ncbi:MAG: hypothetical protein DRO39_00770 [Thermoprotei archaeon]|nr:MAG: hypothetical protein DRO39_00770 [Thermoprotei archaeon]
MTLVFKARRVFGKDAEGVALISTPLSPLGDIDPESGVVKARDSPAYGERLAGRVLVMRYMKGSTVGTYVLYALGRRGAAPRAIVVERPDPVLVSGCVLGGITLAYGVEQGFFEVVRSGMRIRVSVSTQSVSILDF